MENPGSAGVSPASFSKGWYSRGYLPHFDAEETFQAITFRLADSLPKQLLDQWQTELASLPNLEAELERRKRIESCLDKGHGKAWLRQPKIAKLVEDALLHFDGDRYNLHAWVIMPNHVHLLILSYKDWNLSKILHTWKSYTAKQANKIINSQGKFWQEEYFDRYIRDEKHYIAAVNYIEENPVKAGLCSSKEHWPYGSAMRKYERKDASETLALPGMREL